MQKVRLLSRFICSSNSGVTVIRTHYTIPLYISQFRDRARASVILVYAHKAMNYYCRERARKCKA